MKGLWAIVGCIAIIGLASCDGMRKNADSTKASPDPTYTLYKSLDPGMEEKKAVAVIKNILGGDLSSVRKMDQVGTNVWEISWSGTRGDRQVETAVFIVFNRGVVSEVDFKYISTKPGEYKERFDCTKSNNTAP